MLFEGLSSKLQDTFARLRGKGKLNEEDVKAAMREVRLALLDADVNFKIVKDFVERVRERAVGQEVLQSLTPAQSVIKIVNDELAELMGGTQSKLAHASKPPTIVMMVGLQGAGKTTTAAKLANMLKGQGRHPLMIAADIYRPAAIKQLQVLGEQIKVPVFSLGDQKNPVDIVKQGLEHAKAHGFDYVFIDTAGRLHIDEPLMEELRQVKSVANPAEILLVLDAMTGQVAVEVAETFDKELSVTGAVLTKLDGDTRGGAALSIRAVTGTPIKFAGIGEKIDGIEPFHPDRMASRILGMGDVMTLIEKAQANIDHTKAREMEKKMMSADFSLDDFLDQMQQIRKMGPLQDLLKMLPGMGAMKGMQNLNIDEKQLSHVEAIIRSMTVKERQDPKVLNGSRRKRIAAGSGRSVQEVNRLLNQFAEMQKMMKQLPNMTKKMGKKGKKGKGLGGFKFPF